jgi:hypothetical protein
MNTGVSRTELLAEPTRNWSSILSTAKRLFFFSTAFRLASSALYNRYWELCNGSCLFVRLLYRYFHNPLSRNVLGNTLTLFRVKFMRFIFGRLDLTQTKHGIISNTLITLTTFLQISQTIRIFILSCTKYLSTSTYLN